MNSQAGAVPVTADPQPKDKYNYVYTVIIVIGIGTVLPWNTFINANSVSASERETRASDVTSRSSSE